MTALDLLQSLKAYCEEQTKDLLLATRLDRSETVERGERAPRVFIGSLPSKEAEKREAPYILLKLLTTSDTEEQSIATVRIIVVTYHKNRQENYIQCSNVISRLRISFLEKPVVANRYTCQKPLESLMYEDDLEVYQIGEMLTTWELPPMKRMVDVNF